MRLSLYRLVPSIIFVLLRCHLPVNPTLVVSAKAAHPATAALMPFINIFSPQRAGENVNGDLNAGDDVVHG